MLFNDHELLKAIGLGLVALMALMFSAEKAVKKIHGLADHFGFSNTFAGLTIFSITTSFPEIFAHLTASLNILAGTMDYQIVSATVLGANIGSDVVQQTFVLGLIVVIVGGLKFERDFLLTAYLPMIGTTLMCIILGWDGIYSRLDGFILFGTFIAYMIFLYNREKKHPHLEHFFGEEEVNVSWDSTVAVACMLIMLLSAHFLLIAAERAVEITGLGASLVGVLTVGVAAAAPELFTALSGVRQKAVGISLGTLIGSNITNPLVAIGGGAIISTYWVPGPLIYWDLMMETITAALLLAYLLLKKEKGKLGRVGGFYLIGLYFFYVFIRIRYFSID